ncbi:class I ribonucleotide reductase maintenance protein YfaE [Pseudoalteromonas mariniglutinosa]|uniref:class I ribonucleotide reductase maintenance protein YfaE n=1 Tax=Pseudoalteromonas mariniglutinosa TaxID=206042 RepID=UPI00384B2CEE
MSKCKSAAVTLAGNSQSIEFDSDCSSLLECLEQHQIDIPFQCREGYCGACRATLIEGNVDYNQEPLAFVRSGEVLLCCTKPNGKITIKI